MSERAKTVAELAKTEPKSVARPKRRLGAILGDIFSFALMTLGSITLCAALFFGAWAGWIYWGRDFWAAHIGAPPF